MGGWCPKVIKIFLMTSLNGLCLFATPSSDSIVHTIIPSSPYYHTWDWVCWVLLNHPFTIITGKTWPWKCDSFGKWIMFACSLIIIRLHYIEKGCRFPHSLSHIINFIHDNCYQIILLGTLKISGLFGVCLSTDKTLGHVWSTMLDVDWCSLMFK